MLCSCILRASVHVYQLKAMVCQQLMDFVGFLVQYIETAEWIEVVLRTRALLGQLDSQNSAETVVVVTHCGEIIVHSTHHMYLSMRRWFAGFL